MMKAVRRLVIGLREFRIAFRRALILTRDQFVLRTLPRTPVRGGVMIVKIDAIGDFILWLDAAKELRAIYPHEKLVLVANSIWADIAARLPFWDEVWPVDIKRVNESTRYRFQLFADFRQRGFARAIQPTFSRVLHSGDSFVFASGAPERIGSAGDLNNMAPGEKWLADRFYTRLLPSRPDRLTELERNAEFIRLLSGGPFEASVPKISTLGALPEPLRFDARYLIAFPGASIGFRQWPAARFAQVANQVAGDRHLLTLVCGSIAEHAICQEVADLVSGPVINLAGKTSLPEFVELVRRAELLIGNETSAVHVAAAVATPSVCILGGGHYGRFMPYPACTDAAVAPTPAVHFMSCFGCDWHCTRPEWKGIGPVPCIGAISTDSVLQAAAQALSFSAAA